MGSCKILEKQSESQRVRYAVGRERQRGESVRDYRVPAMARGRAETEIERLRLARPQGREGVELDLRAQRHCRRMAAESGGWIGREFQEGWRRRGGMKKRLRE